MSCLIVRKSPSSLQKIFIIKIVRLQARPVIFNGYAVLSTFGTLNTKQQKNELCLCMVEAIIFSTVVKSWRYILLCKLTPWQVVQHHDTVTLGWGTIADGGAC